MVLDAVAENIKNLDSNTRRSDVLQDIIDNNDYQEIKKEQVKKVNDIFSHYVRMTANIKQKIIDFGLQISQDGKHHRLTYYNNNRYKTTPSKTGSDHREGKNIVSQILNKMIQYII